MENEQSYFRELQPGVTLQNGKYQIERVLGAGGFGITYYARHTSLNQHYAIKEFFIDGRCVRNTMRHTVNLQGIEPEMYEKYRRKFTEEAQTLAKLDHPNIVRVIDVFEENETSYIVMPFIEGKTLESLVEKNGPLDYGLAVNYIGQIANAVGYIHSKNILHRDIKPDNIMITADNHAILIDFGSAREFIQDKTQHQTSILTKGYAPIEQYSSNSRKGTYTDIYSLGAVFYYVLTGTKPMDAAERLSEEIPEPKQINPRISDDANRTIMKAMQLKHENRHQTIDEFMNDMLGQKTSVPSTAPVTDKTVVPSTTPNGETEGNRKTLYMSFAVIGVLALVIGIAIFYHFFVQVPIKVEELREQYIEETKKCTSFISSMKYSDGEKKIQGPIHGIVKIRELEKEKLFAKTKLKPQSKILQLGYQDSLVSIQNRLNREMSIERSYMDPDMETTRYKNLNYQKSVVDNITNMLNSGSSIEDVKTNHIFN